MPIGSLLDSRQFLAIQSRLSTQDDSDDLLQAALRLDSTFQEYQIPIIALSNAALEDVVEVFRRVNSTGTPLSPVGLSARSRGGPALISKKPSSEFAERYRRDAARGPDR